MVVVCNGFTANFIEMIVLSLLFLITMIFYYKASTKDPGKIYEGNYSYSTLFSLVVAVFSDFVLILY